MRSVIQRVSQASVSIGGRVRASVGKGLLVLLGIEESDTAEDAAWLAAKIAGMRIFNDAEGKMNLSVKDVQGDVLVVSQFTLHACVKKGNRPSFVHAAKPEVAIPLYKKFIEDMEFELARPVFTGEFGAMMEVSLNNDGPVTIIVDTKIRK